MDFELSEEQRRLCDSVARLLADCFTFDKRRAHLAEPDGWSRALWATICRAQPFWVCILPSAMADSAAARSVIEHSFGVTAHHLSRLADQVS